jgi:hypothetical protein
MLHRIVLLIGLLTLLAGCGTAATITPPTPEPTALPAAQPTTPPEPTAVPQPPTTVPAPTSAGPSPAPPTTPPEPTAAPAPAPTAAAPTSTPQPPAPQPAARFGEEILFQRERGLWAYDLKTGGERRIAEGVEDFSAGPGGAQIALLRGAGRSAEIWVVGRDGAGLRQVTKNDRAEASLAWAPDGTALIYASSAGDGPLPEDWQAWARWCAASEIRTIELASGAEAALAAGCEPSLSPDGRRIAYSAPPQAGTAGGEPGINSVRLINRLGQNGWNFAKASGQGPGNDGLIVYAPAWSSDGMWVIYHRFMGMQVEVDINLSEIGGSFEGKGRTLGHAAGLLMPARFSPSGRAVAITANDYGNARGLVGYGAWQVELILLEGAREIAMPDGPLQALGQSLGRIPGGQNVAWSPNGAALAVQLPPSWRAGSDPEGWGEGPGEIWRWAPGGAPDQRLIANVDFGSTLAWLPAS